MSFDIGIIDMRAEDQRRRVFELHDRAFEAPADALERQLHHNSVQAPTGGKFYGAFDQGHLVGVAGLIRQRARFQGRLDEAFQLVAVATDPEYRGRGVLTELVEHAHRELRYGAAFIFAFPNESLGPILTGRLHYQSYPLAKVMMPMAFFRQFTERHAAINRQDQTVYFDQSQAVRWKLSHRRSIVAWETASGMAWGTDYTRTVFGIPVRMRTLGGLTIDGLDASAPAPSQQPHLLVATVLASHPAVAAVRGGAFVRPAGIFVVFPFRPMEDRGRPPLYDATAGLADTY